jgi:hypothetical protein
MAGCKYGRCKYGRCKQRNILHTRHQQDVLQTDFAAAAATAAVVATKTGMSAYLLLLLLGMSAYLRC